ncbi:MAG: CPBP family intramembrane metalloprotease [Sphingomonadales bacterium]|nr:MAG: CPBP family intramembrane metalloprotease [Sphingomonadales bacterium]
MKKQSTQSGLSTFLCLTVLFTAPAWALIIYTGQVGGGAGGYVRALMWAPGVAALATVALKRLDIGILGLGWGKTKYNLAGYLMPVAYTAVAYSIIWLTGLGGFPSVEGIQANAERLGWNITDPVVFVPAFILLVGTTSMVVGIASGLGEELGWRGFLAPQLVLTLGFTGAGLVGGLIWAVWHFPIILFADYNFGTPTWFAISCFTLMVIGVSFIMQWLRLKSGSVWPAAILHGAHNVFIQTIFTPLTSARGSITDYAIDEFGFVLPIIVGMVALYLWMRRDEAVVAMKKRMDEQGVP